MRSVVSQIVLMTLISLFASQGLAKEPMPPLATVDWAQLKDAKKLKAGDVVLSENDQPARLKIVNADAGTKPILLCEIDSPPITTPSYAVRGKIRYDTVVGVGFLEMWNHFPSGQYFTRTMDTAGPMAMVTGTSPEREFILPFHTLGQTPAPKKLVLNLVLNGPGTVEIGPLELIAIDEMTAMSGTDWWTSQTGGLIGGIGGTLLGLLGSVIGVLTSLGKGKKLVLTLAVVMAVAGSLVLISGIYAVASGQTYNVYYPLLMMGGMMIIGGVVSLVVIPNRFRIHELRRMQALDLT